MQKVITGLCNNIYLFSISPGLEDYLGRYRQGIRRVLSSFGPIPEFDGEAATRINKVCAHSQKVNSSMNSMNKIFVLSYLFLSSYRRSVSLFQMTRNIYLLEERDGISC